MVARTELSSLSAKPELAGGLHSVVMYTASLSYPSSNSCAPAECEVVRCDEPSAFSSVSSTVLPHCCAVWLAFLHLLQVAPGVR